MASVHCVVNTALSCSPLYFVTFIAFFTRALQPSKNKKRKPKQCRNVGELTTIQCEKALLIHCGSNCETQVDFLYMSAHTVVKCGFCFQCVLTLPCQTCRGYISHMEKHDLTVFKKSNSLHYFDFENIFFHCFYYRLHMGIVPHQVFNSVY